MVRGIHQGEGVAPGANARERGGTVCIRGVAASGVLAIACGVLISGVLAWLEVGASTTAERLVLMLHVIGVALFLAAGVLRLSRWRIIGERRSLLMGGALVVLGGVAMPLTSLAGAVAPSSTGSLLSPLTAVATTSIAVLLVATAVHDLAPNPHWMRATLVVPVATGTAFALFLILAMVHAANPDVLTLDAAHPRLVRSAVLTMAWLGAGVAASIHSDARPWAGRVAPLLGCMSVAEALRTVGVFHAGGWEVSAGLLVVVVAGLSSRNALADLAEAMLADRKLDAGRADAAQEELQHDARNALAGVRAALVTLDQFGDRLDPSTAARLRTTVLDEVGHLEHMLLRDGGSPTEDFDLEPLLMSVAHTRRTLGARISLKGPGVRVHGRPGDLVTVLQNLLVNAAQHGAGQIVLSTVRTEEHIEIHVSDDGPGIPSRLVDSLFERGVRGPASTGSGLGLHIARNLMRAQGGDLQLRDHLGACSFACVLSPAVHATSRVVDSRRRTVVGSPPGTGALVFNRALG